MAETWRVVLITAIAPMAETYVSAVRALGHDVPAVLAPRRDPDGPHLPEHLELTRYSAPDVLDLLFARDKHSIERLLRAYEPDLVMCSGFPWKIPQAALDVPRLGSINLHPALLPRHRGPIPLAWALRDGDPVWGTTWHRMPADIAFAGRDGSADPVAALGDLLRPPTIWSPVEALAARGRDPASLERYAVERVTSLQISRLLRAAGRIAAQLPLRGLPCESAIVASGCAAVEAGEAVCAEVAARQLVRYATSELIRGL